MNEKIKCLKESKSQDVKMLNEIKGLLSPGWKASCRWRFTSRFFSECIYQYIFMSGWTCTVTHEQMVKHTFFKCRQKYKGIHSWLLKGWCSQLKDMCLCVFVNLQLFILFPVLRFPPVVHPFIITEDTPAY